MKNIENRPKLNLPLATSEIEQFQNKVLRPILKQQNDLLVQLFKLHIHSFKLVLKTKKDEQEIQIRSIVQKDKDLKHQLIGITIGLFNENEFDLYTSHYKEYNRRIITMIAQRIFSNMA